MQSADTLARTSVEDATKDAANLHWLAFLLTGNREVSIDIAVEAIASGDLASPRFTGWMRSWSRRIVMAKALTAQRSEIAASARRTESAPAERGSLPKGWSLDAGTSKARIEEALLAIEIFPRAAVVLTVLERVAVADAAVLLDSSEELVRKGQAIGLRQMVGNLAGGARYAQARERLALLPALAQ
jgi:DNA-directed RNA polymerase specialized sigma24 family protein